MKIVERVLLKVIMIQFIILLFTQLFFHKWNSFPELQQITQYEGVSENNLTEVLETFSDK
ncbi:YpfB family protein [Bacillus sp. V3B]|uniref:YpfB family protein n=1 Tax=Bacillus sp. V3B TaxID=2804915 RepID=UPI00210A1163|nr:YpfB family protein [Bacillus sp. V3B]MCQ6273859.1 YpfB family protein [Bacillus sp. V3B]